MRKEHACMRRMSNQTQTVNPTIGWSNKTEREGHGPPRSFGARPRVLEILRPINKFREHKIPAVWIGGAGSSPVAAIATHTSTVRTDTYTQARALLRADADHCSEQCAVEAASNKTAIQQHCCMGGPGLTCGLAGNHLCVLYKTHNAPFDTTVPRARRCRRATHTHI